MNNTENTAWNAAEFNRKLDLIFRIGIIVDARFSQKGYSDENEVNWTNEDQNHAYRGPLYRVKFADSQTYWMPMLALRAGRDQSYWAFEVGEQVVVLCASGDPMQSVIIGALYQNDYRPPVGLDDTTSDKRPWRASVKRERFADNTMFEYDRDKHRFTASFLSAENNQFQYQGDSSIRKLTFHIKAFHAKTDGNVKIDADGTVNIKAGSNINIEAGSTIIIKGGTITAKASTVKIQGGSVKITGVINLN